MLGCEWPSSWENMASYFMHNWYFPNRLHTICVWKYYFSNRGRWPTKVLDSGKRKVTNISLLKYMYFVNIVFWLSFIRSFAAFAYPDTDTDIVLMCFSITSPISFKSVLTKRYPKINHNYPIAPIILVGTKVDLRDNKASNALLRQKNRSPITYIEASGYIFVHAFYRHLR